MEIRNGRDPRKDYTNEAFGTMQLTQKMQGSQRISYGMTCSRCGATGQRVTQDDLARGITPTCKNSGCGSTAIAERRQAVYDDSGYVPSSARARMDAARIKSELDALGGENAIAEN
jgi:hypothetical protein